MRRGLLLITISAMLMVAGTLLLLPGESRAPDDEMPISSLTQQTLAQRPENTATISMTEALPAPTEPSDSYTVREGDTLFSIAGRYNVTVEELLMINDLADAALIYAGQTLLLPATSVTIAAQRPLPPTIPPPTLTPPAIVTAAPNVSSSMPSSTATTITAAPARTSASTSPAAAPLPAAINAVPLSSFMVISEATRQNIRYIFAQGQAFGRNPRAFSKLGDSTIEPPHFLSRFDEAPGTYQLGQFVYLADVIAHYQGAFGHSSVAVRRGMHAWSAFDPAWSNPSVCLNGEGPLACELRSFNPSVIFIRLGSNDVGVPEMFERSIRRILTYCLEQGVIPIVGTKADRHEGSNINNEILRQVAADFAVPLWDFDLLAETIPGRGLDADNVHMTTFFAHDYGSPTAFTRGHGVHNLTALMMLDAVWRVTISG